jgi:hypothetical protein
MATCHGGTIINQNIRKNSQTVLFGNDLETHSNNTRMLKIAIEEKLLHNFYGI